MRRKAKVRLLQRLFTPEQLRRVLLTDPTFEPVAHELPSGSAPPAELYHQAVLESERRGLCGEPLLNLLVAERPYQEALIRSVFGCTRNPAELTSAEAQVVSPACIRCFAAAADEAFLVERIAEWRQRGHRVTLTLEAHDQELLALGPEEDLHVFWSSAAAECETLCRALAQREVLAPGVAPLVWALDGTPLPEGLLVSRISLAARGSVSLWLLLGVLLSWVVLGLLVSRDGAWGKGLVLGGVGIVILALQYTRSPARLLGAAWLHGWGVSLRRARAQDLLAAAERLLDRVYGVRLWSLRSAAISSAMSLAAVLPLLTLWALKFRGVVVETNLAWLGAQSGANLSLIITVPLALCNVVFDFFSLLMTRKIIRRLKDAASLRVVLAGLLLDSLIVLLAMSLTILINPGMFAIGQMAGSPWAWVQGVWSALALLLTGGIRLSRLDDAFFLPAFVTVAGTCVTAAFPSLVHGSLLLLALVTRLSGYRLSLFAGRLCVTAASDPQGPLSVVYPLIVMAVSVPLLRPAPPEGPPEVPRFSPIVSSPLVSQAKGGSRAAASEVEMAQTELRQGWWREIWDRDAATATSWGLPRYPAVFVGDRLPVETVSWCEVARFANLWSKVEGLTPAYCVGARCLLKPGPEEYGLPGCETGAVLYWDRRADGYRLPTDEEWTEAALAVPAEAGAKDLKKVAIFAGNSGMRSHFPCERARDRAGRCDMLGNVMEYTHGDAWTDQSEAPIAATTDRMRRFRGGAWFLPEGWCARSFQAEYPLNVRGDLVGFRLVRPRDPLRDALSSWPVASDGAATAAQAQEEPD